MFELSGNILRYIFNLVLPPFCVSCNNHLSEKRFIICDNCYSKLDKINEEEQNAFLKRIKNKHFDELFIKFHFSKLFQQLMHYFKYEGFLEIADYFAISIIDATKEKYDIITCVPLHSSKERERGFNQSKILSAKACELLKIESVNVLVRTRYTESQTKLTRGERKENMSNAFKIEARVENKSILLIDDVITTGATLNECAKVLKNAGAKKVDVFAMATPVDILQEKLEAANLMR